ncbi:MAG: NADP-dependent malic enzyme [Nitrospinota bacterium]
MQPLKYEPVKYTVEEALAFHRDRFAGNGKIEVISKVPCRDARDLTLAYTPGVAVPCREIAKDIEKVYEYTAKGNMVAVVTDGTAVLGLGDIGPEAGLPVMEGKCVLFKMLAGVDAFPICLRTKDTETIISAVKMLEPGLGGINLEDISAPRCFDVLERLRGEMDIPVFHDDQHGTAVVTLAAMKNSLKLVGKKMEEVRVAVNGAGASGIAVTKLLQVAGVRDVILCDTRGVIYEGRKENMNKYKEEIAKTTNPRGIKGTLADAMEGADVFLGLSVADQVTKDMVRSMNTDAIVMAMANPDPEIMPEDAAEAGARIIATGRSDYPNQINNVLGFPGIFRGALAVRATDINEKMFIAAAESIASLVDEKELSESYIATTPVDPRVMPLEAAAVAKAAMESGVARVERDPEDVKRECEHFIEVCRERFNFTERYLEEHK